MKSLDKIFNLYWRYTTWFVKPIGPYYRWLWKNPVKKFFIISIISVISTLVQLKMLQKVLDKYEVKDDKLKKL